MDWIKIRDFEEISLEVAEGIAKISICRPRYRNAFTPKTTAELSCAFSIVRERQDVAVVLLTGQETPRKEDRPMRNGSRHRLSVQEAT